MKNKIIIIIMLVLLSCFGACIVYSELSENNDMKHYSEGLEAYRKAYYRKAYDDFSKISPFSCIKMPALFRQARCADLSGDIKSAQRNYRLILFLYPYSRFYAVSEYNLAMLLYNSGDTGARKHFINIIKYYPETDYALASEYYIASIDMDKAQKIKNRRRKTKLNRKVLNRFLRYIKNSPDGRFAQDTINKISKLEVAVSDSDSLIIANSFFERGLYDKASAYFSETPIKISWAKYAKNEFKRGNPTLGKSLVENALKYGFCTEEKQDAYNAIDEYVKFYEDKPYAVDCLMKLCKNSPYEDYLLYLKSKYSDKKYQLYEKLYYLYPESEFSPEVLYKMFYSKAESGDYDKAVELGRLHISHFKKSDTSPAVLFWMGKIYEYKNNKPLSKSYYKSVISKYPDSYYGYRAYSKLHKDGELYKTAIKPKPIVFPSNKKSERNMAGMLIDLGDYDFIKELYKDDKFVQSWAACKQGKSVYSVILAQDAMKNLYPKPPFDDVRWRLVYPLNYLYIIEEFKGGLNARMVLSIIREESHFDPKIKSPVNAIGLMQLMPATANELAVKYGLDNNLYNPETNIKLGSLYYSELKKSLGDVDIYALMSYNGGRANVERWRKNLKYNDTDDFIEKVPFIETQMYVKKVLRSYWCYSNIYR